MVFTKRVDGFSLIEVILVVMVTCILIVIAGGLSGELAKRRSVDRVTTGISSTLYITKLEALRRGVEYQVVLTFDPNRRILSIVVERGNSNRRSSKYEQETSQTIRVIEGITITPSSKTYNFNPNGTLGSASGTLTIRPVDDSEVERCGRIVVNPFGRMRVIRGNWDRIASTCNPIE
ncbi:MAG TPA: GspH/FimT family pseudopilin [Thermodesulfobacteriota bacterium]|nr:GspH/FimT family pseudopilin [Thermodesulfobacteriota bacterium]